MENALRTYSFEVLEHLHRTSRCPDIDPQWPLPVRMAIVEVLLDLTSYERVCHELGDQERCFHNAVFRIEESTEKRQT